MDFGYVLGNREDPGRQCQKELQAQLDRLQCGLKCCHSPIARHQPTRAGQAGFQRSQRRRQDMKRLVNEAEETYNKGNPQGQRQC